MNVARKVTSAPLVTWDQIWDKIATLSAGGLVVALIALIIVWFVLRRR